MLSIGIFSKIGGATTKALRYYDEIGLLKPAQVDSDTGYRYYDVEQLKEILLINKFKAYEFSLEEIAKVMENPKDNKLILSLMAQKEFEIKQKLSSYDLVLKQMKQDVFSLERGNYIMSYLDTIEVKLVETEPMNILSIRKKMNIMADFGKYLGMLFETIVKEKLTSVGPPMVIYHGEEFDPESYDTEIAIPVKEVVTGTRDLPGQLCAHATHKGIYSEVSSVYSKICEWIEKEGYTIVEAPFDIYTSDPQQTKPDESITEVYFPVKK